MVQWYEYKLGQIEAATDEIEASLWFNDNELSNLVKFLGHNRRAKSLENSF